MENLLFVFPYRLISHSALPWLHPRLCIFEYELKMNRWNKEAVQTRNSIKHLWTLKESFSCCFILYIWIHPYNYFLFMCIWFSYCEARKNFIFIFSSCQLNISRKGRMLLYKYMLFYHLFCFQENGKYQFHFGFPGKYTKKIYLTKRFKSMEYVLGRFW